MQKRLLYLYIHNFRNIKEQGFNLSSAYDINFSGSFSNNNFDSPKIKISLVENEIPNLFHSSFTDVKGIIGENGAGKSTLLQYLAFRTHRHLDHQISPKEELRDIIIFEDTDDYGAPIIRIFIGEIWNLEKINVVNNSKIENLYICSVQDIDWDDLYSVNTSVIYYSNVFDNKFEASYNGLNNISTNFLIKDDLIKLTNDIHNSSMISESTAHSLMENNRRISFALLFQGKLPFSLPDHMHVYLREKQDVLIEKKIGDEKVTGDPNRNGLIPIINTWLRTFQDTQPQTLKAKLHKAYFDYLIFHHLLDEHSIINAHFPLYPRYKLQVMNLILDRYDSTNGISDLDYLISDIEKEEAKVNENIAIGLNDSKISKNLQRFAAFDKMLKPVYTNLELNFSNGFKLPINETVNELYDKYKQTVLVTDYLDFTFPDMSSGELGFLTLFSRFFSLIDPVSFAFQLVDEKHLLILIDEGDLYFHPRWQVTFMDYLNDMLPKIFEGKTFQVIITSHSPFIASDFPKSRLLMLKKGTQKDTLPISGLSADGFTVIAQTIENTFGANIHELLADSFFLEGAHIGQLAKKTIYKVLDQLSNAPVTNPYTESEILRIIDKIGEPWVKSRLLEKYEIFSNHINDL